VETVDDLVATLHFMHQTIVQITDDLVSHVHFMLNGGAFHIAPVDFVLHLDEL
jgi:hypothetical protein